MTIKAQFKQLAHRIGRAIEPRAWRLAREQAEAEHQRKIDERNALFARMKPRDGTTAFMQDPNAAPGVVIAVDPKKLLAHVNSARPRSAINRSQIRRYGAVVRANRDLHLMPVIYWDNDNTIHMQDGNHRLDFLQYEPHILVTVTNWRNRSEEAFNDDIKKIIDICGSEDIGIVKRGNAAFCRIDFDESGHYGVRGYEQLIVAPYYSVQETAPSPSRSALPQATLSTGTGPNT